MFYFKYIFLQCGLQRRHLKELVKRLNFLIPVFEKYCLYVQFEIFLTSGIGTLQMHSATFHDYGDTTYETFWQPSQVQ